MLKSKDITHIFQESYPNLCRFLESIVGRNTQAQDIAQESFLRLCKSDLGAISNDEVRFWLFRVARNIALNEINKNNYRRGLWRQLEEVFYRRKISPEEEFDQAENSRIVVKLLRSLPEHQRSALLLREHEDMSYRQIAAILNISESKVKVDIYRGRQALRKMWFEDQEKNQKAQNGE